MAEVVVTFVGGAEGVMVWGAFTAVVVAVVDTVVAPSAVSLMAAVVTNVPVPTDTSTVAAMFPSEVPAEIGVAAVDVHVRTVLPDESTQL